MKAGRERARMRARGAFQHKCTRNTMGATRDEPGVWVCANGATALHASIYRLTGNGGRYTMQPVKTLAERRGRAPRPSRKPLSDAERRKDAANSASEPSPESSRPTVRAGCGPRSPKGNADCPRGRGSRSIKSSPRFLRPLPSAMKRMRAGAFCTRLQAGQAV